MPVFKVTFLKNQILSILEITPKTYFEGNLFFEQVKGQLIFAIIKAENENFAMQIAKEYADNLKSGK